jgi:hypothetical protein
MDLVVEIERNGKKVTYVTVAGRLKEASRVNGVMKSGYTMNTFFETIGEDMYAVAEYSGMSAAGCHCQTKARAKVQYGGYGPNKVAPVEIAETSAVGRALGFAGFGIDAGVASADEIQAVSGEEIPRRPTEPEPAEVTRMAALRQYVRNVCQKAGFNDEVSESVNKLVLAQIGDMVGTDVECMSDEQARIVSVRLKDMVKRAIHLLNAEDAA